VPFSTVLFSQLFFWYLSLVSQPFF